MLVSSNFLVYNQIVFEKKNSQTKLVKTFYFANLCENPDLVVGFGEQDNGWLEYVIMQIDCEKFNLCISIIFFIN